MTFLQLLLLNLTVQICAMCISIWEFLPFRGCCFADDLNNESHGWRTDPLTEVRTESRDIRRRVGTIEECLKDQYVTRADFDPVRRVVYGLVGLVLTTAVGSILALIWNVKK